MRTPLFDPALYRHPAYAAASVCALLYGALLFGLSYLLPIHFQLGLGLSATAAGLWLIAPGVAVVTAIHFAGRLTDRLSFRPVLASGFVLAAFGTGALAIGALAGTVLAATAWAIVARSGTGLVFCALNTGATRVVPESLLPQVPGATNFFRILGGGLGVKAVSLFMDPAPPAEATVPAQAVAAASGGFAAAFLLMTLLAGIALLATWHMRPLRDGE
jgi:MFS family permease